MIRRRCVDCSGGSALEAKACRATDCVSLFERTDRATGRTYLVGRIANAKIIVVPTERMSRGDRGRPSSPKATTDTPRVARPTSSPAKEGAMSSINVTAPVHIIHLSDANLQVATL